MIARTWLAAFLCLAVTHARAESLVAGLSQDQVQITSSYTGTNITIFGAIESAVATNARPYDVVVALRGPDADMTVRRKVRIAGIWINRDAMSLFGMPTYYFVASERPLAAIASAGTLQRYQLGLANVVPQRLGTHSPAKAEPFRLAAISDRAIAGLYNQDTNVEFLSRTLFRVSVPIPATVLRGQYIAEVYLFRDGNVISAVSAPLHIDQTGLERRLFNFAHERPFLYGLAVVSMATIFGWLSALLFRRDA